MAFLLKQRAFLKLYVMEWIQKNKGYGYQMLEEFDETFKPYGYSPAHSEIYTILKELWADGYVTRDKKLRGSNPEDFQEIVLYRMTDKGKNELEAYRKLMKVELERCEGLLRKALKDHYS